jgi:ABC-type arginine transport system ATPase subunit
VRFFLLPTTPKSPLFRQEKLLDRAEVSRVANKYAQGIAGEQRARAAKGSAYSLEPQTRLFVDDQ